MLLIRGSQAGREAARRGERHIDVPADDVPNGGAAALVGHVIELQPGAGLEQCGGKIHRAALAGRAVAYLAWLRLGERDQHFNADEPGWAARRRDGPSADIQRFRSTAQAHANLEEDTRPL